MLFPLLFSACVAWSTPATTPPPNVLVIVLDDVGHTERSLLASMSDLAAEGLEFSQFRVYPVCSITRYASLMGRYPRRAGIGDTINAYNSSSGASPAPNRLDVTLFEALLPSHTNALVGKWHLGRLTVGDRTDLLDTSEGGPFGSGVESWLAGNHNSIAAGAGADGYYDWIRVDNELVRFNHTSYATAEQRDELITWIGAQTEPWFAWFAPNAAHAPYDPPPGMSTTGTERGDYLQVLDYVDAAVSDVLASVDLDETLVFYYCDNGTPDGARVSTYPTGYWKGTTYEGGIRVPLVVAGPGVGTGTSGRLISATDIPATILELVGAASRGFDDSLSFADELGSWSGDSERTWLLSERYDVPGGVQPAGYDDIAFVEGPTTWPGTSITVRLKRRIVDADGNGGGGTADLLYDLISDPYELSPGVYSSAPPTVRSRFDGYLSGLPARP